MASIFKAKLHPHSLLRDSVLTGKRFLPTEAAQLKIVDEVRPKEEVVPAALKIAHTLLVQKDKQTVGALKREMHKEIVELLRREIKGDRETILSHL